MSDTITDIVYISLDFIYNLSNKLVSYKRRQEYFTDDYYSVKPYYEQKTFDKDIYSLMEAGHLLDISI